MRYLAENFDDYGFSFLEKLHSPIFLVSPRGSITKINEAGRKFMSVAHLPAQSLSDIAASALSKANGAKRVSLQHLTCRHKHLRLIANRLGTSDYYLVEVIR